MLLTIDYETFFDSNYSLTKMSEVAYIRDPRFEVILCSLKVGHEPTQVYTGFDAISARLAEIDWAKVALLSHNVRFDGAILAWHFGYVPAFYLDTLSMARATSHWTIGRSRLAKVAEFFNLPAKGDEVIKAKGKRLADFDVTELARYREYCVRDTELCRAIFDRLRSRFRTSELHLMDMIARMFILPQVQLNESVLEENYRRVQADKAAALQRVSRIAPEVFSSNVKFAALLDSLGVEVPMKTSPATGQEIPALAKGDWGFKELCADDTQPPEVQLILAARTAVKSTLEETRSMAMLKLARTKWRRSRGWAPIALKYSGARTHRLSGDGGMNWQNLPRGSLLRQAVEAPPGMLIVHRDASQIEARMVAWMASCYTLLDAFAENRDVYSEFASIIYEKPITKENKLERFVGKTAILGLGYGCGADKFRRMLFIGNGGISLKVTGDEASHIVNNYRSNYPEISELWDYGRSLLRQIIDFTTRVILKAQPQHNIFGRIPVTPGHNCLILPNQLRICYSDLRVSSSGFEYTDPNYKSSRHIYGAKTIENISQALSRIVVTDIAVRLRAMTGYIPFLTAHDSLSYCVPESEAEALSTKLAHQFEHRPSWAPKLPLASEGGWGKTLIDAEKKK